MRNRGEKKIVNDLLSSPDLLVDCCVFDARSPRQKGRILTKSAPVPWLSSRYHDFAKKWHGTRVCETMHRLAFTSIQGCMGQGTLHVMPRCRWRCGRFRCCCEGREPRFLGAFFYHCWTVKFVFQYFEKYEETASHQRSCKMLCIIERTQISFTSLRQTSI